MGVFVVCFVHVWHFHCVIFFQASAVAETKKYGVYKQLGVRQSAPRVQGYGVRHRRRHFETGALRDGTRLGVQERLSSQPGGGQLSAGASGPTNKIYPPNKIYKHNKSAKIHTKISQSLGCATFRGPLIYQSLPVISVIKNSHRRSFNGNAHRGR